MAIHILIVSPDATAQTVADTLRQQLDASVEISPNRRAALLLLRREEFSLLILDESLTSLDAEGADSLFQAAGTAPVLEVNLAITSAQRVVRQVKGALQRRRYDQEQARTAAATNLHNELNASLAGLLLESQLALRQADPTLAPRLQHLVELAGVLREQLRH